MKPPEKTQRQIPPVAVKFEAADFHTISDVFETAGELKADKESVISAERAGQVETIFVTEGDWVKEGDVLVKIKANDVRADLALAESDYESYQKLEAEGAISRQELLQVKARLEKLQADLNNSEIRALFSGVVGQIYIDLGDYLKQGDAILDLVKNQPLRVTYTVPEKLIPFVKIGQSIEFETDANPGRFNTARIDFISPRVDPVTRTVLTRAKVSSYSHGDFGNPNLKANQFVKVKQKITGDRKSLMVREEAIYLDQGQQFLYLAREDDSPAPEEPEASKQAAAPPMQPPGAVSEPLVTYLADRKAVETGARKNGLVEIITGIAPGDLVIYAGLSRIYPGAKLINVTQ